GEYSEWVRLSFPTGTGLKVRGLARFYLGAPKNGNRTWFHLYVTPLNIDPEHPAMPISHPGYYATYLAKLIGPYATLGLAEDTWGLSEGAIDEAAFLKQSYDIHQEREKMFFASLDRLRQGTLVCVFDITDRLQHMFWRFLEKDHPANKGKNDFEAYRGTLEELYKNMDEMVGRVMRRTRKGDVLMVLSDHGFKSFQRGVNLNSWFLKNGYLALKDGAPESGAWFQDVDWSRTKAFALGLGGMFLNMKGREGKGIVEPSEAQRLKKEIIGKLNGLRDEEKGTVGINKIYDADEIYRGPYRENSPDMIIGYNVGYRVSWKGATGVVNDTVFDDNTKAWSGDHSVDPNMVPGVLFSSRKLPAKNPALMDLAPTILELFGVAVPAYMDGKSLLKEASES
ncbi:MAG: alkaline phosphatase family protein, partial [Acidobacteria bacterium]|nr:alkaline phosphatase family protein [Acidobacteriota bacterium]